ncbi:ABC transporter substrate-binding protein [Anaerococcus lactolyticus]|uniref:ABC transporter substrate-binding protein n=1 Tax=Anaerococcus lactolyticus S7-1-13 TaxID=1284686 RepID=A0A095X4E1_9FIRM|nr:ABC transporter substrate-binding protein [Anaerococcus lactolyticus]KGF04970.1 ABC transporter substrate-binding protein [Anaerococcus lactolyticus S7-1-13]
MKKIFTKIAGTIFVLVGIIILGSCGNKEGKKEYIIGVIQIADHPSLDAAREGFLEELDKEGISYKLIDHRAGGDISLIPQLASDLKIKGADLIYTIGTPAAQGVYNIVNDRPILFTAVTDPIGAGLVDEKTRTGKNITGVSDYVDPAKVIDDFLKVYPETKTFATMYNTNEQNSLVQIEALEKAIKERGLSLKKQGVSSINDIPQALASLKSGTDAMVTVTDNVVVNAMPVIAKTLKDEKIPSLAFDEGSVENGALIAEGVNYKKIGQRAGEMAGEILEANKDIKELPFEDAKDLEMLVNKDTAKDLGLDLKNEGLKDAKIMEKKEGK